MSLRELWNKWGKCIAAILGGGGIGMLTGAGVGSAVPWFGTIIGAVIGGTAGGLTGAASGCEGDKR